MKTVDVVISPYEAQRIYEGRQNFILSHGNCHFDIGDTLRLREWSADFNLGSYTGREFGRTVTCVVNAKDECTVVGFVDPDKVQMTLPPEDREESADKSRDDGEKKEEETASGSGWKKLENEAPPVGVPLMVRTRDHSNGGEVSLKYPVYYIKEPYRGKHEFVFFPAMEGMSLLLKEFSDVFEWLEIDFSRSGGMV